MNSDIAKTSLSLFVAAALLFLLASWSFFSPLAVQTDSPWPVTASRALAHFLPACIPAFIGLGLRYSKVWAWYFGVFYMAAMFGLGLYLSIEHFFYLLSGNFIPPVFLLLSFLASPSLFLLLRGKMRVLHQLRNAAR